ncbi:MAG TPA: hypothetical protein VD887_01220 [Allosphingosinicella sp.]|nr:hypothetical protein [Allosphingosinicella sp.]
MLLWTMIAALLAGSDPYWDPCPPRVPGAIRTVREATPGVAVTLEPVAVAEGAVVALETQNFSSATWRSLDPMRIRQWVFPVGTILTLTRSAAGEHPCFDHSWNDQTEGVVLCLSDRDRGGRYRRAIVMDYGSPRRSEAPLRPAVRLERLDLASRDVETVASRRIRVARVHGDTARLVVELNHTPFPQWNERGPLAREVRLREGRIVRVGGLPLRVGRGAGGWTLTPLAPRFPRWIRFDCIGSAEIR